jgi:hypothetical protein
MSLPAHQIAPLLTAEDVAGILRCSLPEVYVLKDRIGYVRVGSRGVRFEQEAVYAYIAAQRRCHAPALVSSNALTPPSGRPSGPTIKVMSTVSPRVAATMERLRRGSRRAN